MKSMLLNLFLFTVVVAGLWACQSESNDPPTPRGSTVLNQNPDHVPDTCLHSLRGVNDDTLAYVISENCAQRYIADYDIYIDQVNESLARNPDEEFPNSGEKLVYGANVDLEELRRILAYSALHSDSPETDSLYIMMGIMPSDSTELIFALKTTAFNNTTPKWAYFDFTRPCPTGCPAWINQIR